MKSDPRAARYINAVFPWDLAVWGEKTDTKVVHVSSDCCYSGKTGKYVESSIHDAEDDYGKSKSLGEPIENCMVIRTSIIGEEIHKDASLIAWAKSQAGKTVNGYTHHLWNGITTNQYGAVCDKIIQNGWYEKGLFHVHAPTDVNKYQMMQYFNAKFNLNLTINAVAPGATVDRTLRSEKSLCGKLNIPTVEEMVNDL
jgi:dTDP-4-dehydrorhamnose reductase